MEKEKIYSAEMLSKEVKVNQKKWNNKPSDAQINKIVQAIKKRGINVELVAEKAQALEKIKQIIPAGAQVMNGSSTTLIEIGFMDYLKGGTHGWKNFHETILSEKDQQKQMDLRQKSITCEYFLSGLNAIAKTGELVACDASGSRVGAFPFGAKNLILVSGVNKITPTLQEAIKRIEEYAFPLENARAKKVYGSSSSIGKTVIISNELLKGRTTLILVNEKLGY